MAVRRFAGISSPETNAGERSSAIEADNSRRR